MERIWRRISWGFMVWISLMKFNFVKSTCNHGDFIPDGFDCRVYYRCDNGRIHQFTCPDNLLWNQNILTCDWPRNVQCSSGSAYTSSQVRTDAGMGKSRTSTTSSAYRDGRYQQQQRPHDYNIFCYYKPPSRYNHDEDNLKVENIDTSLCTHIVFDAATIDAQTGEIVIPEDWLYNVDEQVRYLKYQNPQLKILLRVGSWDDGQQGYAKVSSNPRCRKKAVERTKEKLNSLGFDGLDLNWMYPVCPQGNCDPDRTHENDQYAALMHDMREGFDKNNPRLTLAASVPSCQKIIKISFNRHAMTEDLDHIIVTAQNNHEHWEFAQSDEQVGLQYSRPNDRNLCLDGNCTMHWLAQMDMPREKLIEGIRVYAYQYTVKPENGNYASYKPPAIQSEPTTLPYSKVCKLIQDPSWNVMDEQGTSTGPHAYKDNEWISYMNPRTVTNEVQAVKQGQFGGVAIQTIDMDDHEGSCNGQTFPILRSTKCALKRQTGKG